MVFTFSTSRVCWVVKQTRHLWPVVPWVDLKLILCQKHTFSNTLLVKFVSKDFNWNQLQDQLRAEARSLLRSVAGEPEVRISWQNNMGRLFEKNISFWNIVNPNTGSLVHCDIVFFILYQHILESGSPRLVDIQLLHSETWSSKISHRPRGLPKGQTTGSVTWGFVATLRVWSRFCV